MFLFIFSIFFLSVESATNQKKIKCAFTPSSVKKNDTFTLNWRYTLNSSELMYYVTIAKEQQIFFTYNNITKIYGKNFSLKLSNFE
jgi:hypothetical protein